jgi:hypothetical protein
MKFIPFPGRVRKIGGSLYVKIDKCIDKVENGKTYLFGMAYEIKNIEPLEQVADEYSMGSMDYETQTR